MTFDALRALGYHPNAPLTPENVVPFRDRLLAASESMWRNTRNPIYVWQAIWICADLGKYLPEDDTPYPRWVQDYLVESAQNILALQSGFDASESTDVGRLLPGVFGFAKAPGRGGAFSLARAAHTNEKLALRFAEAIYSGQTPVQARATAAEILSTYPDDKTLARRVNKYFGVGRNGPKNNGEWQALLTRFFEKSANHLEIARRQQSPRKHRT